jgi:hypothetical protein
MTFARILSLPVLIGRSCIAGDGCLMTLLISACSSHFRPARRMRSPFSPESREATSQVFSDKAQLKDTVVRVLYRLVPL